MTEVKKQKDRTCWAWVLERGTPVRRRVTFAGDIAFVRPKVSGRNTARVIKSTQAFRSKFDLANAMKHTRQWFVYGSEVIEISTVFDRSGCTVHYDTDGDERHVYDQRKLHWTLKGALREVLPLAEEDVKKAELGLAELRKHLRQLKRQLARKARRAA